MVDEYVVNGTKYRVFHLGMRRIEAGVAKGMLVQSGSRIERYDDAGMWIYVCQMHPDDVENYFRHLMNAIAN